MEDNQRTDCSFRLSLKIITVTEAYAFMHPIIDNTALLIAPHGYRAISSQAGKPMPLWTQGNPPVTQDHPLIPSPSQADGGNPAGGRQIFTDQEKAILNFFLPLIR